jgi:hypothetical protein
MTSRNATRVAWAVCALSTVLGAGTIVLALLNETSLRDFVLGYSAHGPVVGIVNPLLGALIITRYPGNRIGWVLCATGLGMAAATISNEYATYVLLTRPGSLPGGAAAAWWFNFGWMPVVGILPLLFLLFPDGGLRTRRWRPAAWATAATIVVPPAVIAAVTWPYRGPALLPTEHLLPAATPQATLLAVVRTVFFVMVIILLAAGMASVLARLRHATGRERQQIKWLLYGGGIAVAVTTVNRVFPALDTGVTSLLVFGGLVGAIAVAIFRHQLYDIDRIINRTLVYALLTTILAAGYTLTVLVLGSVVGRGRPSLAVAGATLAMAATFQPARSRIQDAVDRRFNRRRYDAAKTIQTFSGRLRAETDLDTLATELVTVVGQTMEPTTVALWLRPPGQPADPQPRRQQDSSDPARE